MSSALRENKTVEVCAVVVLQFLAATVLYAQDKLTLLAAGLKMLLLI